MFPWWVQPKKPSVEGDVIRDGVFDYKKPPSLHRSSSPVHCSSSPDSQWHVTSRKQSKKRMKNVKVGSKTKPNHTLMMSHSNVKISSIGFSNSQVHFKPEGVHSKHTNSGCLDMPDTKIISHKDSATIIPHASIVKYLARKAAKEVKEAAHSRRSTTSSSCYDHCQPQCLPARSSMKLKESSKERKGSHLKSEKSHPGFFGHELHISKAISHTQSLFKNPVEYKTDNSNCMHPVDLSALESIPWQSHHHNKKECRISPEISISSLPPLSGKEETTASNLSFSLQAHSLSMTAKYPRILNGRKMVGCGLSDRSMNIRGYPDPFIDGSPKYHQRLIELLGLVSDTMRTESRCKSKCKNYI